MVWCFSIWYFLSVALSESRCIFAFGSISSLCNSFSMLFIFLAFLLFFLCTHIFFKISAKFHLWPSSGDLPRPRIGMLSLLTVSPVITAFHSCCLSHHVFDLVNLWPAWVGFETAIFWQCSPGTVETQRLSPLHRRAIKDGFLGLINPYILFILLFICLHISQITYDSSNYMFLSIYTLKIKLAT